MNEGLFFVRRRQGLHPGDRASGRRERGRGTRALELKVGPAKSVRRLISRPRSKQSPWRFAPFSPRGAGCTKVFLAYARAAVGAAARA